jgi:hypothetical protein
MKYTENLVYYKHCGGYQVEIYDINDYRFCITYATGSSVAMYKKEDAPLDTLHQGNYWGWLDNKAISTGWWYMNETVEEAIDRQLHKVTHPNQLVWYGKRVPDEIHFSYNSINYTDDNNPETIKQVESNPNFISWYKDYETVIQENK